MNFMKYNGSPSFSGIQSSKLKLLLIFEVRLNMAYRPTIRRSDLLSPIEYGTCHAGLRQI